jgi:replicative DNA helicase
MPRSRKKAAPDPLKVPPNNVEAEKAVLGSILLRPDSFLEVANILKPEDFYREAHAIIYQSIQELFNRGSPIDVLMVTNTLKEKAALERVGGLDYLVVLTDLVLTSSSILYHAQVIKEMALRRRLVERCYLILEEAYGNQAKTEDLLETAEQGIYEIAEEALLKGGEGLSSLKEVVSASYKELEEMAGKGSHLTGLTSGYEEFDKLTTGLQPSELIVVAGRPGTGKTAFALNIAYNVASKMNEPVAIFSLEMSKVQLGLRFLSMDSGIDSKQLRVGFLKDSQYTDLLNSLARLAELPIYIDESSALTVLEMKAKCRRLKRAKGLGLVIVDYLQLVQGRKNVESRQLEISEISRGLKAMAKDLNVPVIAVSQLNRKVEDRPIKRPQLADLRESGAIEQDADLILFIYRDETQSEGNVMKVEIAKNRNGPMGSFKLYFSPHITRFFSHTDIKEAVAI